MTTYSILRFLPRPILAAGVILTGSLALPAAGLAGPASPPAAGNQERLGDIEKTVPPGQSKKSFDPLKLGLHVSPKQVAARRHKCARAAYIVKQANGFKDESPLTVRYYQQALDYCPGHPEANFRLGVISYHKKDIDAAISSFQRSVKSDPKFVDGYYNLAIVYRRQKKLKEARKYFLSALKHDPRDPLALYNIGVLQYLSLERDQALRSFKKSIASYPKMAEPHFFIGALYQEKGLNQAAKEELHNAIRLAPKLTLPRIYLSAILETEGNTESAKAELNKAIAINPASVNIGYGVEEFYLRESKGNEILSHIRMRRMDAPRKQTAKAEPPPKGPEPKAAPGNSAPPSGKTESPEKSAREKKNFEVRREAREIPVRPAPPIKKQSASKKKPSASKKSAEAKTKGKNLYRIRRGDTLAKIAIRYGTTLKTLIGLNHNRIEHPSVIEVGDIIRVPRKSRDIRSSSPKQKRRAAKKRTEKRNIYRVYRIKRGDTLTKVASRFRISVKTLLRVNRRRIKHPDRIEVGTKIRIPGPVKKISNSRKIQTGQ